MKNLQQGILMVWCIIRRFHTNKYEDDWDCNYFLNMIVVISLINKLFITLKAFSLKRKGHPEFFRMTLFLIYRFDDVIQRFCTFIMAG